MIRVVLFDLDGVIRHFDPAFVAGVEREHGLAPGIIERTAFAAPLLHEVTTGRITRAEWMQRVGERIGSQGAAERWRMHPSALDGEVLALSDAIRARGLRTAILTNGTDTIPEEIAEAGIADRFDAIFNSASIGFAKPDPRAFQHVLDALGVAGPEVFFTDDSAAKLTGAEALGIRAHLFRGVGRLRVALREAGVATGPARVVGRPDRHRV